MRFAAIVVGLLATACVRDPATAVCPDIAEGDLVITEVGGAQTPVEGQPTVFPFIELYNASGAAIDLLGLRVRFRRATGADIGAFIVRSELRAEAGAYTTLGLDNGTDVPTYFDYGFSSDFHVSFPSTAVIQVEACGTAIDQLNYDSLPKAGSYSYTEVPPSSDGNDVPARWCTDTTANAGSFPGTPQRANTPCP